MLNCIIIEDQPPAQKVLERYIQQMEVLNHMATFEDAISAEGFMLEHQVDVMFLDINLPLMSGMDFLRSGREYPFVILTTAYSEYALESFQYNVVDYLLKPFSFDRFAQAVGKIEKLLSFEHQDYKREKVKEENTVYLKSNYEWLKVDKSDILYIKSDSDYVEIITKQAKHLVSESLKNWNRKLGDSFCQVHKSYLINLKHIVKIAAGKVYLTGDLSLPIGRAFKKEFLEKYKQ